MTNNTNTTRRNALKGVLAGLGIAGVAAVAIATATPAKADTKHLEELIDEVKRLYAHSGDTDEVLFDAMREAGRKHEIPALEQANTSAQEAAETAYDRLMEHRPRSLAEVALKLAYLTDGGDALDNDDAQSLMPTAQALADELAAST